MYRRQIVTRFIRKTSALVVLTFLLAGSRDAIAQRHFLTEQLPREEQSVLEPDDAIPLVYGERNENGVRLAEYRHKVVGKRVQVEGIAWGQPFAQFDKKSTISAHAGPRVILQGGSIFINGVDFSKCRGKTVRVTGTLRLEREDLILQFGRRRPGYFYIDATSFEVIDSVSEPRIITVQEPHTERVAIQSDAKSTPPPDTPIIDERFKEGKHVPPTARAEQAAGTDARWVQSSPKKLVWSSKGSANVRDDHSIELQECNDWQEVTLYFQLPELAKIKRVLLEVLPSTRPHANGDHKLVLFDIKPHLERVENGTTQLEFRSCRFLGNEADETAANCIDFLSDTGWTVPDFVGKDACHQLVLELSKPITVQRDNMFAITIDSGGAPDLKPLSRIRVSFSGTHVVAKQRQDAAITAGTEARTMLKGLPFEFRWCPPGEFQMGSPPGAESKYGDRFVQQHQVKLTRGFWMMETEVTQAQYAAIMGHNPSFWQWRTKAQNPVEQVTWADAVSFCKKLSALDKEFEYRLPTEAEWEYACRAGEAECRYGDILEIAWVFMNTGEGGEGSSGHRPVGTKTPNKWGLHDMFGNVAEWCADWKAPPATEPHVDPKGPLTGEFRIVRGDDCFACWTFLRSDGACMAGSRSATPPSTSSRVIGFRIVRVPRSDGITKP